MAGSTDAAESSYREGIVIGPYIHHMSALVVHDLDFHVRYGTAIRLLDPASNIGEHLMKCATTGKVVSVAAFYYLACIENIYEFRWTNAGKIVGDHNGRAILPPLQERRPHRSLRGRIQGGRCFVWVTRY